MLRNLFFIAMGGALGSSIRYAISVLGAYFQWSPVAATFTANVLGSVLMGMFMVVCANNTLFLFATVGFCGGFTTFSTFSAQTLSFLETGQYGWALSYAFISLLTCVAAVGAGTYIGKLLS